MQRNKIQAYLPAIFALLKHFKSEGIDVTDEMIVMVSDFQRTIQNDILSEVLAAIHGKEISVIAENLEIYCRLFAALLPKNSDETRDEAIRSSLTELIKRNEAQTKDVVLNRLYLSLPLSYLTQEYSGIFINISKRNLEQEHPLATRLAAFRTFHAYILNTKDLELKMRLIGHLSQYSDDKEQAICDAVRAALTQLILKSNQFTAAAFISACLHTGLADLQEKINPSITPSEETAWFGLQDTTEKAPAVMLKLDMKKCHEKFMELVNQIGVLEKEIAYKLDGEIDVPISFYIKIAEKVFKSDADAIVTSFFPKLSENDWLARILIRHFADKTSRCVKELMVAEIRATKSMDISVQAAFSDWLITSEATELYRVACYNAKKPTIVNHDCFAAQLNAVCCLGQLGAQVDKHEHLKLLPHFRDDCVREILRIIKIGSKDDEAIMLNEMALAALTNIMRHTSKLGFFTILSQCLTQQLQHLETKTAELTVQPPEKQDKMRMKLFGRPTKGVVVKGAQNNEVKNCVLI